MVIGATAGSAWLGATLTRDASAREKAARLLHLSRSDDAQSFDVASLSSPALGAAYNNAAVNEQALRLADRFLGNEAGVYAQSVVAMRVSGDARVQKAQGGEAKLLRASYTQLPVVKVSAAAPAVMRNRSQSDLDCLTQAVYYEARGEGSDGMRAVAQVILNRVRHPSYPKTICHVVYQGSYLRTGCQFSFACDGSLNRRQEAGAWRRARTVAEQALNGSVMPSVGTSTHFHTTAVSPRWAGNMVRVAQIGTHVFYQFGGRKSRLNGMDGVQPSGEMPVIAAAPEATPATPDTPVLMTVLAADTHVEPAAVAVSATIKGKPAEELSNTLTLRAPTTTRAETATAPQVSATATALPH